MPKFDDVRQQLDTQTAADVEREAREREDDQCQLVELRGVLIRAFTDMARQQPIKNRVLVSALANVMAEAIARFPEPDYRREIIGIVTDVLPRLVADEVVREMRRAQSQGVN